jgi:hypothetical protein
MRQNPGIKVTEVVKQIAKLWQSLSKEEKQRYKEAAKQGKFIFNMEISNLLIILNFRQGKVYQGIAGPHQEQQDSGEAKEAPYTLHAFR